MATEDTQANKSSSRKIEALVVDDEEVVRVFFTRFLNFKGVGVEVVEDGFKAIEAAKKKKFDLVFLDMRMPRIHGLMVYGELKKINPQMSFVFMTGYALEADLLDFTRQPQVICLKKPFDDLKQIEEILNNVSKESDIKTAVEKDEQSKRAYIRLGLVLEVNYKLKGSQGPFKQSPTQDISPGGIRFTISESLSCGTLIELIIRTLNCEETFKATAEVVWNKEVTGKIGYYETGIKFKDIDYEAFSSFLKRCNIVNR